MKATKTVKELKAEDAEVRANLPDESVPKPKSAENTDWANQAPVFNEKTGKWAKPKKGN